MVSRKLYIKYALLTSKYWGLQQFGAASSLRLSAVRYRSFP